MELCECELYSRLCKSKVYCEEDAADVMRPRALFFKALSMVFRWFFNGFLMVFHRNKGF